MEKYKIENSKNWTKIEEFVSSLRYEQTVEKPLSLSETTKIIPIFSRYKKPSFLRKLCKSPKKVTKNPKDSPLLITNVLTS